MQAMSRAHRIGQTRAVAVFRLFTRGTVEERVLELAKRKMALDHVFRGGGRTSAENQRLLQDVLKWGAAELFDDGDGGDDDEGPAVMAQKAAAAAAAAEAAAAALRAAGKPLDAEAETAQRVAAERMAQYGACLEQDAAAGGGGGGRGKRVTYDEAAVTALLDSARATLSEDGATWEAPAGVEAEADADAGGLGSLRPQMWVFDDAGDDAAADGGDGEDGEDGGDVDGGGAAAEGAQGGEGGGDEGAVVAPPGESGDYWESLLASRHAALRAREEADAYANAAPRLRERRRPATYVFEDEDEAERRRKRARAGEAAALAACDGWGLGADTAAADWEAAEEAAEERRRRKRERRERATKGTGSAAAAAAAQRRSATAAFASVALAPFDPLLDARPEVTRAVAALGLPADVAEVSLELGKYLLLEEPVASRNAAFTPLTLLALVLIAADTFGAALPPQARTPAALGRLFGQPPEAVASYCAVVFIKVQRRMEIIAASVHTSVAELQQQVAGKARELASLTTRAAESELATARVALAAAAPGSQEATEAEEALRTLRERYASTLAAAEGLAVEAASSLHGALRVAQGLSQNAHITHMTAGPVVPAPAVGVAG